MNREIKFRGYSIKENKWKYGYLSKYNNKHGISDDMGIGDFVYKESIGEYTGYKDINDIEICEGDIVETTRALNHIVGKVVMLKGCWYIQDGKDSYYRLIPRFGVVENKVIGNVYENKELLEENYE